MADERGGGYQSDEERKAAREFNQQSIDSVGQEAQSTERLNPVKGLTFHSFEPGWWDNPANKSVYDSINSEYGTSTIELRILAEVSDVTVYGVAERIALESKYGDSFYQLRPITEETIQAAKGSHFNDEKGGEQLDNTLAGYHAHGRQGLVRELAEVRRNMDTADKASDLEVIAKLVDRDGDFKREDATFVGQFATSLVVFIKDDVWEKYSERYVQETSVTENANHCQVGAMYSFTSKIIYAPAALASSPNLGSILRHEYSHLIDHSVPRRHTITDSENRSITKTHNERPIEILKTEITAYLTDLELEGKNPFEELESIGAHIIKWYPAVNGTPEDQKNAQIFIDRIKDSEPFLKSLMAESGFDREDLNLQNLFLRTFITALPNSVASNRILESMTTTGLYQADQAA